MAKSMQRAHSLDELEGALRASKGMVSVAAKTLNMTRSGLYDRINKSERLQTVVADEREAMTDTAELSLHRAIVGGQAWAVCFYLKTQGKSRGYVERQEISGPDGKAVEVSVVDARSELASVLAAFALPAPESRAHIEAAPSGGEPTAN